MSQGSSSFSLSVCLFVYFLFMVSLYKGCESRIYDYFPWQGCPVHPFTRWPKNGFIILSDGPVLIEVLYWPSSPPAQIGSRAVNKIIVDLSVGGNMPLRKREERWFVFGVCTRGRNWIWFCVNGEEWGGVKSLKQVVKSESAMGRVVSRHIIILLYLSSPRSSRPYYYAYIHLSSIYRRKFNEIILIYHHSHKSDWLWCFCFKYFGRLTCKIGDCRSLFNNI